MFFCDFFITLSLWLSLIYYIYIRLINICFNISLIFILSEIIIILLGCINLNILLIGTNRFKQNYISFEYIQNLPHILIIIPTLNEDLELLSKTFDAIKLIDYPNDKLTIVIGDDGKRQYLESYLNKKYKSFHYHTRKRIEKHAKAGNLNDIIFYQINNEYVYKGDLVLILDCDMIPEKDILKSLIPPFYFYNFEEIIFNQNCAFVQSPQNFYNIKGYDFLGQHYKFFYNVVLKAYSGFKKGVPCCGTNVLFNRNLLLKIKGFQYGSITEDFNTSLLLHSNNFESKYILNKTATGMAPLSLIDFYNQRKRWAIGGLQMVFKNYKLIFKLPFVYQWIYGYCSISCLFSLLYLILFSGPILDLFFTNYFCPIYTLDYLIGLAPYTLIYLCAFIYLHSQLSLKIFINSLQESIFMIPYYFCYTITFFMKKLGFFNITFKITPKIRRKSFLNSFLLVLPFFFYFLLIFYIFYHYICNLNLFIEKLSNLIWILILAFQLYPPICYFIQHHCCY
jgi:cellulose synthase (UDP-forming)